MAPVVSPIIAPVAPVQAAQGVSTSAMFRDMGGLDVHTAAWDWGDGMSSEAEIIEQNGAGSATGSHVYSATGVYTVALAVTDNDGLTGSCQAMITVVDTMPPDVSILSPEDGKTYINTQGKIVIEYTVEDTGDPDPDIVVTLDGEIFTDDAISLYDVALGEHKLVVSATDYSGNVGEASTTFYVEPQALEVFQINNMTISWAPKSSYTPQKEDKFIISGWLQLPEGYTQEDLDASATITISIADGLGEGYDTLVFKKQPLGRLGILWMYSGHDNPPGKGIDITSMTIWFTSQSAKPTTRAWFNISGVLKLPNVDKNTEPAKATITIELPIAKKAGYGSLTGKETIAFKVFKKLDLWSYLP
jgi:PKD repeat protein